MNLSDPIFHDETKAREYFEALTWPSGPFCPHCGETEKVYRLNGKSHRPGLLHCNSCNGSFTVRTGGVMESSHVPLTKWALAFRLYAASKKGFSAHELMRVLGLGSYRTAWFMAHRIREAMAPAENAPPMGGKGKVVEADETFLGKSIKTKRTKGYRKNVSVLSLVERGGAVRSFPLTRDPSRDEIVPALYANIDPESTLHTDGANFYKFNLAVPDHEAVDHNKTYVRKGRKGVKVHTNTAEGYFSIFKRGMVGTYQHCGEQHLHRYLNEFDFRASNRVALGVNDDLRTERAITGAKGKRLTYHQVDGSAGA